MVSVYGRGTALMVSSALHQSAFFFVAFLYFFMFKSIVAGVFLVLIGALLFLEHRKAENIDLAFFKINILVGFAIFLFVLSGIYLP